MKALLSTATGGPDTLTLGELPRPSAGKGQIVIDVKACAVNFPDVLIIEDKYQFKPERPFAPGGEVAGLVAEVGEGVTEFKVGDRVIAGCGNGGMAEAIAVSIHNVYHLPEAHDFAEGASLLMTYGTSIHALVDRGHIQEGDTLLVLESMKMEIPVSAPAAGTVKAVLVAKDDTVEDGQPLVELG